MFGCFSESFATFWSWILDFYMRWSVHVSKTKQKECIKWLVVIISSALQRPLWVQTHLRVYVPHLALKKRHYNLPPYLLKSSHIFFFPLTQIKSDKTFSGEVIYKLEGPGVDQEPKNLFEIDDKKGVIRSKQPLDREKHRSFTVRHH